MRDKNCFARLEEKIVKIKMELKEEPWDSYNGKVATLYTVSHKQRQNTKEKIIITPPFFFNINIFYLIYLLVDSWLPLLI